MRIFLTGAAGLIGGEVAARLVRRGHGVTAGIHRDPVVRGNDGGPVAVRRRVSIDLGRPLLGLDLPAARALAADHDLVLHCAATTRFDLADEAYRRINVDGTAAALALAALGDLPLLQVGTAFVCGSRSGLIREDDPLPLTGFTNGYEASKATAEALVHAADPRHVTARPSIVVGDRAGGVIRRFDTVYAIFRLIAEGRMRRVPATRDAALDLVPIDHVAAAIVALAERMPAAAAAGGRFHLVSAEPAPTDRWLAAIGDRTGGRAERIDPERIGAADLSAPERLLLARFADRYAAYLTRAPRFDDRRLRALTGLVAPPCDRAYLDRLIGFAIRSGFVRPVSGPADSAAPVGAGHPDPTISRPSDRSSSP